MTISRDDQDDCRVYVVVVNNEGQYSIWPSNKSLPDGWNSGGKTGSKIECLQFVNEVWTDMRPRSLQRQMTSLQDS